MAARRVDPPPTIILTLRPNGATLAEEHVASSAPSEIEARCADLRRQCRDERGWTPTFQIIGVRGDDTAADITYLYRVN